VNDRRSPVKNLALLAVALAFPALALAGDAGSRQEATYRLTQELPGKSTGEKFRFDYVDPENPDGKPPAVQRVVTKLPRRGQFDASVPGSCGASDAELMAQGAAACPRDSLLGGGVVTVDTGLPEPARIATADVVFANNADDPTGEFIYINTVRDAPVARTVIRADVKRRKTITNAGFLPGVPPEGGSIDTVDIEIDPISERGRNYITTPPRCREGHWVTKLRFSYPDGESQVVRTRTPCKAGSARAASH
jgi:hypothetical protein